MQVIMDPLSDFKHNKINVITVSAVFLLVLLLSFICPLITDDMHFKFIWNGFGANAGQEVRVGSLGDIFQSAAHYYQYSGGRVVCHFLVFALDNLPRALFANLNALMYVTAGYLIYKHITVDIAKALKFLLPFVYLSMFLVLPVWGDSVVWISGSVNYLWAGTAILWALYLIDCSKPGVASGILTCVAVLIASSTGEIAGGMLIVVIVLRMLAHRKHKTGFYIAALVSAVPGIMLILLSPGNANRMAAVDLHESIGVLDVLRTSYGYLGRFIDWNAIVLFPILVTLFMIIFRKSGWRDILRPMAVTIACLLGSLALGMSGVVISRAIFTSSLPLLIPMWNFTLLLLYNYKGERKVKSVYAALITISALQFLTLNWMSGILTSLVFAVIFLIGRVRPYALSGQGRPSLIFDAVLVTILSVSVMSNAVLFVIDTVRYNSYIDQTVAAMKEGDMNKVANLKPDIYLSDRFFPSEGTIVSDYSLSWIYEYHVLGGGI